MNAGAIELVQQQEVLGTAAVLTRHFGPLTAGPPVFSAEHEHVQLHAEGFGPLRLPYLLQRRARLSVAMSAP